LELVRQMWELPVMGVQFEELTRVQSRYIVMAAGSFSSCRRSARPLPRLIHRPLLSDIFSGVMNFTVIRTKAVCAHTKTKGSLLQNLIQATFGLYTRIINIKFLLCKTAYTV
jgi:hypothetical protein